MSKHPYVLNFVGFVTEYSYDIFSSWIKPYSVIIRWKDIDPKVIFRFFWVLIGVKQDCKFFLDVYVSVLLRETMFESCAHKNLHLLHSSVPTDDTTPEGLWAPDFTLLLQVDYQLIENSKQQLTGQLNISPLLRFNLTRYVHFCKVALRV